MQNASQFFSSLNSGTKWNAAVAFNRNNALPIDSNAVFPSKAALDTYAASGATAYPGQVCIVVVDGKSTAYVIETYTENNVVKGRARELGGVPSEYMYMDGNDLYIVPPGDISVSGESVYVDIADLYIDTTAAIKILQRSTTDELFITSYKGVSIDNDSITAGAVALDVSSLQHPPSGQNHLPQRIIGVADPVNDHDAATKHYVDTNAMAKFGEVTSATNPTIANGSVKVVSSDDANIGLKLVSGAASANNAPFVLVNDDYVLLASSNNNTHGIRVTSEYAKYDQTPDFSLAPGNTIVAKKYVDDAVASVQSTMVWQGISGGRTTISPTTTMLNYYFKLNGARASASEAHGYMFTTGISGGSTYEITTRVDDGYLVYSFWDQSWTPSGNVPESNRLSYLEGNEDSDRQVVTIRVTAPTSSACLLVNNIDGGSITVVKVS